MTSPNPIRQRATNRRRSPLPAILLTGLIAAGAVAGATAVFSSRAQDTTQEFTQKLSGTLNASGVVSAQQTGYQKGLTSSTQTMTVDIAPKGAEKPMRLLVTNHIQHGPFPGFKGVGQAVVDTEIKFEDPQVQAQLDRAFGGKKPTIRTLIGLGGSTTTEVQVPEGNVTQDGSTVRWRALSGHVDVNGQKTISNLSWPGLTFSSADGNGEIQGVTLTGDTQRQNAGDQLGTGTSTLKVANMTFTSSGQTMKLGNMQVSSDSHLTDPNHYDGSVKYSIGDLNFADKTLKDVQLHLGVRHLAREPLNRLMTLMNNLQKQQQAQADKQQKEPGAWLTSTNTPELTPEQQKQLETDLLALLKDNPRITIDRLSLKQPGGDIVVTGEASAPKLASMSGEELKMMAQMPALLATAADLHLEAQGSEKALSELLNLFGSGSKLGDAAQMVQTLTDQGYVTRQGDQLKAVFDVKDGQPTLNGKALGQ